MRENGLPKYVASNTLTEAAWDPTTILSGDVPARVAELKRRPGRPAAPQPPDDPGRGLRTHLHGDGPAGLRDVRGRGVATSAGPAPHTPALDHSCG
ncbi:MULTISPECIES: hypothetical protein [Streptomyces]|uniref:hypothetical protein n=1 Tax=Streptomyces TaxID=1883 RepID=UPI00211D3B3F|nr:MULTISPECIES: hypothetical protein [Streptomyces]MCX4519069.1 hypothetical protein [Streptomyces anulatus]MCX4601950.1 hypothetical protein [Streptomyces anulatus]WSU74326.1 hypothetical protein OG499_15830 [Streptomyces anulatus]WTD10587.1 hypothetical protein OHA54_15655 [Streptomyces anulatus]WTE03894.1 hypothetical protein OH765_15755 [Streptomyces anulatus]